MLDIRHLRQDLLLKVIGQFTKHIGSIISIHVVYQLPGDHVAGKILKHPLSLVNIQLNQHICSFFIVHHGEKESSLVISKCGV